MGGKRASQRQARIPSKTCEVKPGGVKGQIQRLTWGDLRGENRGEVSRGHSSDQGRVMPPERRAEEPRSKADESLEPS